MPSIFSSCLILLKLAMAVNDGLHTMLSNIYSVIENAMQSDQNRKENGESVQETSSAPAFQRSVSKSQILEAFNRRRANLAIYEQTDVLVSNLTPFQEITITKKDVEGKKKRSLSPKKFPCKRAMIESNSDVESNVETPLPEKSTSLTNSQSGTSSLVSSDVEIDSQVQSCKVIDNSAQVEEAKDGLCQEKKALDGPTETVEAAVGSKDKTQTLKEISTIPTSRASLYSINKSLKSDSNFLKTLQEQIKLTNENLCGATENHRNGYGPSPKNMWGLTDSDFSNEKGEHVSTEVRSKSATEDTVSSQKFLKETARLYEEFLRNYYTENGTRTNFRIPKESPRAKISNSNPTSSKSNRNQPAFKDNLSPIRKISDSTFRATVSDEPSMNASSFEQNSQPVASLAFYDYYSDRTDSDCTGFGYFSDAKPMSRVSATKHLNTCRVPLSLNKDSWIKIDEVDKSMNKKSFHKLSENPARSDKNEWNMLAPSKELPIDLDCDYQSHPKNGGMFSVSNPSRADNEDVLEASQDFQHSIRSHLSGLSDYQLDELDDSNDLEAVGLARVATLTKLLQDVGATEILNEPNVDEHESSNSSNTHTHITKLVNDFSDTETSYLTEFNSKNSTTAKALKSASTSNNNMLDFNNIPFKDLDTEEKQLNYLENMTERYLLHCKSIYGSRQESFPSMEHTLFDDFEERHKIMLDTITKAYRHELDSLTRSLGICLDDSYLVEMGLNTNLDFLKMEATSSNKDCCNPSASPNETTAIGELDVFGLPVFVQNETKAEDTEHVEDKSASFEVKREASCCVNEYPGLLEMDKDHSGTFTINCSHNETSTPIKDEKLEEQSWISINLSSESQKYFVDATSDDAKSNHCFINSTSFNKDANPCLIENGMENKYELVCSHDANVKDGILVAKDWRDLAAEMSKNYEMCISILNKCDDEAGNSNLNKESNCNESNETCKGETGMGKTETNCEKKEDLPRRDNRNESYLDITKDITETDSKCNTDNLVRLEERESNTVLKKPNDTCSTSNIKYVESAFFKCENSSPSKDTEIHANSKNNALKLKVSLIGEHNFLNSEKSNDDVPPTLATNFVIDNKYEEKAEVEVSDNTIVALCPKPKCGSEPKENPSSQNSEAVRLKEFPSTTKMALVNGELQNKTSLGKKEFLNKEFFSNNFDREVEFYLKCVESKEPKNDEVKKCNELIHQSDYSGTRQDLESMQIGKPSTEEMGPNPGESTPMSNIEDLRRREELERAQMYNCVILNNGTVNSAIQDRHLPLEDSEPNTNAQVRTLLHGVENEELSYNVEVNNDIQIAENSLILDEEAKNVM